MQVEQYQNFSISYEGKDYSIPYIPFYNIANNGGGKAVYETYNRLPEAEKQCVPGFNFTSDQLFWVEPFFLQSSFNNFKFSAWLLVLLVHL